VRPKKQFREGGGRAKIPLGALFRDRGLERLLVGGAKRADRVVIRVVVGAKVTHRHVAVARCLDRPGTYLVFCSAVDEGVRFLDPEAIFNAGSAPAEGFKPP
jgi:hypothetical protein